MKLLMAEKMAKDKKKKLRTKIRKVAMRMRLPRQRLDTYPSKRMRIS